MPEEDIISAIKVKWYTTIFLLVGTILAVADPLTDILTLREFYLKDHKTWFGVGLAFVILPSLVISCLYYCQTLGEKESITEGPTIDLIHVIFFGWNPLALAFTRLKAFILCAKNFKRLWHRTLEDDCNEQIKSLLFDETWSGMFEAILESAPQFIIQLHATIVQQEQVTPIQIISLCVSFSSLGWTFANADVWRYLTVDKLKYRKTSPSKFITKVVFFISQLLHLSSRLFAITFFTVGFSWWIIAVLIFHSIVMAFVRVWTDCRTDSGCCDCSVCVNCCFMPVACAVYWIRDDGAIGVTAAEKDNSLKMIKIASNILFVIENVIMICVFYSTEEPHEWYSVPVTVCVCVFSLVSCLTRVALCHFLLRF